MKAEGRMIRDKGAVLAMAVLLVAGCRSGTVVLDRSVKNPAAHGTIGGILQGTGGGDPLPGRRVEAVDLGTRTRYPVVTSVTGGFSIEVPPGKYRLEAELREGESVTKDPGTISIGTSDLDANILVEVGPAPRAK